MEAKVSMSWRTMGNRPGDDKCGEKDSTTDDSWKDYATKQLLNELISKGLITVNDNNDSADNKYTCAKQLHDVYDLYCCCNKPATDSIGNDSNDTASSQDQQNDTKIE